MPAASARPSLERADGLFQQAFALHQQGRLREAARGYDAVLRLAPKHFDALHLRGVTALQAGAPDQAAAHIRQALAVDPRSAEAHSNLGAALMRLGRLDDAIASFDAAVALQPDAAPFVYSRGCARLERGDHAGALLDLDRALTLRPNHPAALLNHAKALAELGRLEDAIESNRRAIRLKPDFAEAHSNLGNILLKLKRAIEALAAFDNALAAKPDTAQIHLNRGNALMRLKRPAEALASFDRAIALAPGFAEAHHNRGNALDELMRFEEALASFDRALSIQPDDAAFHCSRGSVLMDLNRGSEAIASFQAALALKPGHAEAQWSMSLALLERGDFAEGFRLYEWRKRKKEPVADQSWDAPFWTGAEPLAGRRILVHWEQGLGDTLQFCRYALLLRDRGAEVVLSVQDPLVPLLKQLEPGISVVGAAPPPDRVDFHAYLMSLPLAFGTDLATVPARVPYLRAEPDRVARWRERIGSEGFRIGICWQGSTHRIDRGRSFPVSEFLPLARIPGVRLLSLHKGAGEAQLAGLPEGLRVETPGAEFDPPGSPFLDTAAVMAVCDLVITSDTAVAHLAGALGVPCWVILKHAPDWRWLRDRDESPWYPTMRLFRQRTRGDWPGTFARIAEALQAVLAARG